MQIADNTGLNRYANNLAKNAPQEVLDRLAKLRDTLKQKKPTPPATLLQKLQPHR